MNQLTPFCFVIMGFGEKTDFETGRTLDLDATYEVIIEPAVTEAGLRCVRADEIAHSGLIDEKLYEALYRADLVVADISTGNVNAVYELGVRHALRPYSTIIMKEEEGRLYFDLDHVRIFSYQHLGKDIGAREAVRARKELEKLVRSVMKTKEADSPVYQWLPQLNQPRFSDEEIRQVIDDRKAHEHRLSALIKAGKQASSASRHYDAATAFSEAHQLTPKEPFVIQQWALATYKSMRPSEEQALFDALGIISTLQPDKSNDPETLGITGAIHKRLWLLKRDRQHLDRAISNYGRGFEVRRDYYNGENLATCLDYRSKIQVDPSEAGYDRKTATKVRESLIANLKQTLESASFEERSDRKWVLATLANCSFALGDIANGTRYEARFHEERPADWEIQTYETGKAAVLEYS